LQLVPRRRGQDQHEHVDDLGDCGLGLAHANRLDQHRVEPRRFAQQDRLARAARDAASAVAGRGRPDKGLGRPGQLRHARLVGEDRAAAALRRRIDGEHRDMPTTCDPIEAKALDKGGFAGPGGTRNSQADGAAGLGQQRLDQPFGLVAMVGPGRFDKGDGAGERPPVALVQGRDQRCRQSAASAASRRAASCWRAHIAA
jgi:hypothetical protein